MKVYAIRQISSNHYLPSFAPSSIRNGYTWTDPDPMENGGPTGPRLFPSLRSAQNALTAWLQGIHHRILDQDFEGNEDIGMAVDRSPLRHREDMEIVEFVLVPTPTLREIIELIS